MSVFVGDGQSLVLGSDASQMKAIPGQFDAAQAQVAMVEGSMNDFKEDSIIIGKELSKSLGTVRGDRLKILFIVWTFIIAMLVHLALIVAIAYIAR